MMRVRFGDAPYAAISAKETPSDDRRSRDPIGAAVRRHFQAKSLTSQGLCP